MARSKSDPGRDLLAEMHGDRVDHLDLQAVLFSHYGGSIATNRQVRYPGDGPAKLELSWSNRGALTVRPGPAFDGHDFKILQQRVEAALLTDRGVRTGAAIAFASRPVKGGYRSPVGGFQIAPVPDGAPQPRWIIGPFPFVLEFEFADSDDMAVVSSRYDRQLDETIWTLNALLFDPIDSTSDARPIWALQREGSSTGEYFHTQAGYRFDGFRPLPAGRTDWGRSAPVLSDAEYYRISGMDEESEFVVPESLGADLERVAMLDRDLRARLLRTGYWRTQAGYQVLPASPLWYVAQVAAVEALAAVDRPGDKCPTCLRDRNQRPVKDFKDFLTRYAPGGGTNADLDDLYGARSDLVHGGVQPPIPWLLTRQGAEHWDRVKRLRRVVSVATINWLRDQSARAAGTSVR